MSRCPPKNRPLPGLILLAALPILTAAAPSLRPGMPPEILSIREHRLEKDQYAELAGQWRAYIAGHPGSAAAHVQLARALRYSGADPAEEVAEVARAYELDPDCPEAVDAYAGTALSSGRPLVKGLDMAYRIALRAAELAPDWPDPHFTLWSLASAQGRHDLARKHAEALVHGGAIPTPLLDFGYNLLISAEADAIVFTNGDNDTYPPLALQAAFAVRPDVTVVNLSLLNVFDYARTVWTGGGRQDSPFTAKEIDELHAEYKREYCRTQELFAARILRAACVKVAGGSWLKPVYLAVTVSPGNLASCDRARQLEGLLWRITPEPAPEPAPDHPAVNRARTGRLLRETFRLDSATDPAFPWPDRNSIQNLMINYPAVLNKLAFTAARADDRQTMRWAFRASLGLLEFHGQQDLLRSMADYWQEMDPDNPEVEDWR